MAKVPNKVVSVTPQTEFHTYLQMVRNAPGTTMFRNFYLLDKEGHEFDANDNGNRGCAWFVSSVLVIFRKIGSFHATVYSTILDMERSGWQRATEPSPGDILVWEDVATDEDEHSHIGFYIGDGRAVSTSTSQRMVTEHDVQHQDNWRNIDYIYHLPAWDVGTKFIPAQPNANLSKENR